MYMREYELVYITKPDLEEEELERIATRSTDMIVRGPGHVLHKEVWGKKKMAYEIQKFSKGQYFLLAFLGGPEIVTEIERSLRLDDAVLRYMTVKIKDRVHVDTRIEEARQKEAMMAARRAEEEDEEAAPRDEEEE